jgi:hypothetical protein
LSEVRGVGKEEEGDAGKFTPTFAHKDAERAILIVSSDWK